MGLNNFDDEDDDNYIEEESEINNSPEIENTEKNKIETKNENMEELLSVRETQLLDTVYIGEELLEENKRLEQEIAEFEEKENDLNAIEEKKRKRDDDILLLTYEQSTLQTKIRGIHSNYTDIKYKLAKENEENEELMEKIKTMREQVAPLTELRDRVTELLNEVEEYREELNFIQLQKAQESSISPENQIQFESQGYDDGDVDGDDYDDDNTDYSGEEYNRMQDFDYKEFDNYHMNEMKYKNKNVKLDLNSTSEFGYYEEEEDIDNSNESFESDGYETDEEDEEFIAETKDESVQASESLKFESPADHDPQPLFKYRRPSSIQASSGTPVFDHNTASHNSHDQSIVKGPYPHCSPASRIKSDSCREHPELKHRYSLLDTLPLRRERVVFLSVKLMINLAERAIVALIAAHHQSKLRTKEHLHFSSLLVSKGNHQHTENSFQRKQSYSNSICSSSFCSSSSSSLFPQDKMSTEPDRHLQCNKIFDIGIQSMNKDKEMEAFDMAAINKMSLSTSPIWKLWDRVKKETRRARISRQKN